jgi:hypothetical protein
VDGGVSDNGTPNPAADAEEPDDSDQLEQFKLWYAAARDHWHDWRKEAEGNYDFVAGHQWQEEDLDTLREQMRPAITFNRIGPFVDALNGLEIGNRQDTRYIPRQLGASGVNELLTNAAQWVRDDCDAGDEESDAFLDLVITGMGYTQTRLDYDDDPEGDIIVTRVDPLEMFPDPSARKQNLSDARYVVRVKDMSIDAAESLFPDHDIADLDAAWTRDTEEDADDPHDARAAPFYRNDQSARLDKQTKKIRMVEVEWWEYELAYRVTHPKTGKMSRLSPEHYHAVQTIAAAAGQPISGIKDRRRKYHRAIVGNVILKQMDGPERGGFTYKAMTGKRDRNKGTWYGLVRSMRDPQEWSNKWLSQTLHVMNSNAKGGLIAEEDAFENPQTAEDSWADPQSITFVRSGAIGQGKIKDKPPITFPAGLDRLMQFAIDAIPQVTGVSPELMAQADRDQPGVLEMQRKQTGMTVLARFFDAKRRYQKEQGRLLLWFIQEFISDGRLVRVGGPDDARYVPLVRDPTLIEYDVIVDDAPTSPNMKERVWGLIMQMMPMLSKLPIPPPVYFEMMKYSPLPATLVAKVSQMAQQPAPQKPPSPQEQAELAVMQAKAQQHGAQAQKAVAEAQAAAPLAQAEMAKASAEVSRAPYLVGQMQADIESKRAAAIAHLAQAGIDQQSLQLESVKAALDALLTTHQQIHDQTMDQASLAQQQAEAAQAAQQPTQGQP